VKQQPAAGTGASTVVLFVSLVVIWSSTWVAIKLGLEDTPPLLGAGVRFTLAGLLLLAVAAVGRRRLTTDWTLALVLGLLPFATSYGLIYWSEQHIPSGMAAVLFGIFPLYVALLAIVLLKEERVRPRLFLGVLVALAGLVVAFAESLQLGDDELAGVAAAAVLVAALASAIGNVAIKRRAAKLDAMVLNAWAMFGGGALLMAVSAPTEDWGAAQWTLPALGALLYLAVVGSAFAFVALTVLLVRLAAVRMSYLPLILPFGALAFGAVLADERITVGAVTGAALVVAGLFVAEGRVPRRGQSLAAADAGPP
jgi:drug/metabolite transporter (DMT)-like permease